MPPAAPAVFILDNKPGTLKIQVSGTKQILDAWIDQNQQVWATMPIPSPLRIERKNNTVIVPLDGITQMVRQAPSQGLNQKQLKNVGFRLLEKLSLTTTVPASGVMFVSRKNGVIAIDPVVWVRDIKTLFYETACASGTAAVGIVEAIRKNRNLKDFPILQPSGIPLLANVRIGLEKLMVEIGGPVTILKKNTQIVLNQEES